MISSLIGIIASSGGGETNSYESIATVDVGAGGASTVTFSSIPSTYQHLQIRGIARDSAASSEGNVRLYFNADTSTSNYRFHSLIGNGASTSSQDGGNQLPLIMTTTGNTATANCFGAGVMDVLDYASTNKNKTTRTLTGWDTNGDGRIMLRSGVWFSTSAVTSITLSTSSGSNLAQYSSFALYGIKG